MKQFLFATTAIVAFAGAAAADVEISGSAEMGIISDDRGGADDDIEFHTDIDVTFTLAGATDSGLLYGASIDLDESDDGDAFNNRTQGGEEIFISGGFGRLTMGDTDGALDFAVTEVLFSATAINDDIEHAGYNGNSGLDGVYDGQILRYDYTFGDYAVAVSGEIDDSDDNDPVLGIGFRGNIDLAGNSIGFGLGYQNAESSDVIAASVNGTFAGVQAGISYMNADIEDSDDVSFDHFGIGFGYNSGPLSLHANYGIFDFDDGDESEGFGVSVGYELGDDIEVQFGYGNGDADDDSPLSGQDGDRYSFGVSMSF